MTNIYLKGNRAILWKSGVKIPIGKSWTAVDRLLTQQKSDVSIKAKRKSFHVAM